MKTVERLRSVYGWSQEAEWCAEAANEIVRLRKALREIYEVYANSEGIPQPMTAAEGYLLFLLKETAKIAQETLQEKE
jgi:hypothetical protein